MMSIERRKMIKRSLRIDHRTAGIAVPVDENFEPAGSAFRVWTQDISHTGALVISEREITEKELALKFVHPGGQSRYVISEIIRDTSYEQKLIRGSRRVYCYGVRFMVIVRENDADEALRAAFNPKQAANDQPAISEPVDFTQAFTLRNEAQSLVPLLSACGLVVVYMSQM